MKFPITVFFILFIGNFLWAQPTNQLISYYTFNDCDDNSITDTVGNNNGQLIGGPIIPDCRCGVQGNALRLDGINDHIQFTGAFESFFMTVDISVSFYFKPELAIGTQVLLSKREECSPDNAFTVTYSSNTREIKATLRENGSRQNIVKTRLNESGCWYHVVIVRDGNTTILYIDNEKVAESQSNGRVDLENGGVLLLSSASVLPCNNDEVPFVGAIDELRFYRRVLEPEEIETLYLSQERIISRDTSIFIGDSVFIETRSNCTTDYSWFPDENIDDPAISDPAVFPEENTVYTVTFNQSGECSAVDSILVRVIDPSQLGCEELFLPKAFTPNGDGLNDFYGISNYYVIQELLDFEILDRWGNRVFYTVDPIQQWDGSYQGAEVNPGVFLYRIRHLCQGEELIKVGSVVVMK